ncbi:hypothetical protein SARC_10304 [Sphaeroforma arctica JP610]|uniref:Uncharacterized protein n=1 Tax=Sphaeroforma arctica JP610 TaxID=667725 RepID=A0A0L0FL83_9EUKA|nr:hypothetical protein SARC_10304 [Sphaeroforma arctica JP610]KNC77231.1 hypothetical protein SARC_10304 [Sphaeroforma arctica JP610]|eukprot:XP_014151133.1 hypothetical protein SARC_10304 [Sphaeroforma arctica JP610]
MRACYRACTKIYTASLRPRIGHSGRLAPGRLEVTGDSGESVTGDSGESVTGDSGESVTGDSGESVTGDSGESVTGDSGESVTGDSGESVTGEWFGNSEVWSLVTGVTGQSQRSSGRVCA